MIALNLQIIISPFQGLRCSFILFSTIMTPFQGLHGMFIQLSLEDQLLPKQGIDLMKSGID